MTKLILRNDQSPGDIVMLTAAVRDLHLNYPDQFLTDVRTPCPELWEHNAYITPLREEDPDVRAIDCHYPLIHQSNYTPYHFIHGFIQHLNAELQLHIKPTVFKGDIRLSPREKAIPSQVAEATGSPLPFWIIVAGGKYDFTAKWWASERYQEVVDYFQGKILFAQVGESSHCHPPLNGVVDLRGKTSLRQFVRLMYHAQGVICPVTFAMHLAAAVEVKRGPAKNRPCVVIAGGREPSQWEAYPNHQYIHTNGALPCCAEGGCWKSRVLPLGDGDEQDKSLCSNVVGQLPKCLDLIRACDVIQRIELHFDGGVSAYSDASLAPEYPTPQCLPV